MYTTLLWQRSAKWECEGGKDDLFPFDVTKKCDEVHRMRKLCRYKVRGRWFFPYRQTSRRPNQPYLTPTLSTKIAGKTFFRPTASQGQGDAHAKNSPVSQPLVSNIIPPLVNTPDNFVGGEIFNARLQCGTLSKNKWIRDVVHGKILHFVTMPIQTKPPSPRICLWLIVNPWTMLHVCF